MHLSIDMGNEGTGFLSGIEVERFLAFFPREIRDISLELRSIVSSECPNATERILCGGLSYHNATKGGPVKGAICQIEIDRDKVRLSFIHGARLSDQKRLLVGDRLSKRYLAIDSYDRAPWQAVRGLIAEAADLSPAELGPLPSRSRRGRT
jgi:hypothetical protein